MATLHRILGLAACLAAVACQAATTPTTVPTIETPSAAATIAPVTTGPPPSEIAMQTPEPTAAGPFTLTSSAFAEGGAIPRMYACDGQDASPPLAWTGLPGGTKSVALVMDDPDAGGFVHWVVFNVDPKATDGLPAGLTVPADDVPQGRNSFGGAGYGGPCPPSGTHHYVFRLLALDVVLPLTGSPSATQVLAAADGHTLAEARLTGTYRKGG